MPTAGTTTPTTRCTRSATHRPGSAPPPPTPACASSRSASATGAAAAARWGTRTRSCSNGMTDCFICAAHDALEGRPGGVIAADEHAIVTPLPLALPSGTSESVYLGYLM